MSTDQPTEMETSGVANHLALIEANIFVVALAIGLATFTMTTVGIMIGQIVGERLGRLAEALGGIGLIAIGTTILIEHTLGS